MTTPGRDGRLFSLLARHLALGLGTGLVVSGLFYALDVGGLRTLSSATRDGFLAVGIFTFAMCFTLGALAMGVGVMLHPRDEDYGADMRERRARED